MSTQQDYLTSIANAIRTKLNSSASIQASTFASKIGEIVSLRKEISLQSSDVSPSISTNITGNAVGDIDFYNQSSPYFDGNILRIPIRVSGSGIAKNPGSINIEGSGTISVNLYRIIK